MKISTINKLCCPFDKNDLVLTIISKDISGSITEGFLTCGNCNRIYPLVKGIPIMNPDEYREFHLEQPLIDRWQKHLKGKEFSNFRLVEKTKDN
jgi:uncharacterized protein